MEVGLNAVEEDGNAVSAALASFGMEGLVNIADEVDEEFEGFVLLIWGEAGVADAGGLKQAC